MSINHHTTPSASGKDLSLSHPAVFLATGFGVGLLPLAPGTWGSILAIGMAWGIVHILGHLALAISIALFFCIGVWASNLCIKYFDGKDPKQVVIDEIAAQWLVLLIVPPDALNYAIAFVLFRFFDIFKPWPISWADRTIKGGVGIMLDDVLAAVYSMIILYGITLYLGS